MPLISVVLPVFNAETTVARAIGSILTQTHPDLELIVVDDGSTDRTASVVERIRDSRLRLIRTPHRSVVDAMNHGTRIAQAPFIARMDADDFSYPDRLEKQLRQLRAEGLDAIGCQVRIVDREGHAVDTMARYEQWINEATRTPEEIHALRFVEFPLVNPTILARRAYFELGVRSGDFPEDYDLMLRAASHGLKLGKVPEVLFQWTDGPHRLTRSDPRYRSAAFDHCRRVHLLEGPLKGRARVELWGVGQTGKPWLRWLQSSGITVQRAYDVNPRKIDGRIHGIPVFHARDLREAGEVPVIIAVGAPESRDIIIPRLRERGYRLGEDAWFVA